MSDNAEVTMEGNPSDFSKRYLADIAQAGVNRVSAGMQSLNQTTLTTLGCSHTASEAFRALSLLAESSLRTYNVDLLYAVPGQSEMEFCSDLAEVLAFRPPSLKLYEYVVYPRSRMERLLRSGTFQPQPEKTVRQEWYLFARKELLNVGYTEGRKGSFKREGHRQVYGEIVYDSAQEVLGLGAGAYSFVNGIQFANSTDVAEYREAIQNHLLPPASFVSRTSSVLDLMKRYIVFSLFAGRVSRPLFRQRFAHDIVETLAPLVSGLQRHCMVEVTDGSITLTAKGLLHRREVLTSIYKYGEE